MKCEHKCQKRGNGCVSLYAYSDEISKLKTNDIYCDLDDTFCNEDCSFHNKINWEEKEYKEHYRK